MLRAKESELRRVRRELLGAIFQDPMTSLNPTMRIGRQIGERTHDDTESVRLLDTVGVRDAQLRLRVYPHELSGGLRQRVMAAIAVAGRPALIVADEPTTALDVTVQAQLLDLLRELRDDFGCSVLMITHDLGVADQIADRLAVLHRGELVEIGPATDIIRNPAARLHPFAAGVAAEPDHAPRRAVHAERPRRRTGGAHPQPAPHFHRAPRRPDLRRRAARSPRSTGSTSTSRRVSRWQLSARAARANRPCCASSLGWRSRRRGRSR